MVRQTRSRGRNTGETSRNTATRDVADQAEGHAENVVQGDNAPNMQENVPVAPQGELGQVLAALTQILNRLPAVPPPMVPPVPVVPPPAVPAPAVPPPVIPQVFGNVHAGVPDVAVEVPELRIPAYLTMTDHMRKLGTKYFSGGAKPIEADEWRSRLERNFAAIRCPEQYKKDIAVHYLEGDAHTWWTTVEARNRHCTWATFREEFRAKYFPPEVFDQFQGAFLELRQGSKSVREYELEYNTLMKFAGREFEDEQFRVSRFMRGLRIDLRNRCQVRKYHTMSELVETAAILESGMKEEAKLASADWKGSNASHSKSKHGTSQKRTWERNPNPSKSVVVHTACRRCGKVHTGLCRTVTGACFRCGSREHKISECPERDSGSRDTGRNAGEPTCYYCNEPGHFRHQCPKLLQPSGKRASEGLPLPPPPKRQAITMGGTPRVYSISEDAIGASSSRPITGKFLTLT